MDVADNNTPCTLYEAPLYPSGQVRLRSRFDLTPTRSTPSTPHIPTNHTTTYPPYHTQLRALLYEDVTNTDELRAKLLSGELPEFGTSID